MESGRFYQNRENGKFYHKSATERYLEPESVDLFICHPPYYMAELEGNGGDPAMQLQNAESVEIYQNRMLEAYKHMEYALKPNGHMFIASSNGEPGLGVLPKIANETSLKLQTIRMWDFSKQYDTYGGNHTAIFFHFTKGYWDPGDKPQTPYLITNLWTEAIPETAPYDADYPTAGTAPKAIYYEFIENFSKPGDVVADIFAGSGTVCLVASELSRKFIYGDVSRERLVMAKKRMDDSYAVYMAALNDAVYTPESYSANNVENPFAKTTD